MGKVAGVRPFALSAVTREGLTEALRALRRAIDGFADEAEERQAAEDRQRFGRVLGEEDWRR